ncbi:DUF1801 domain-containing protein [Acidovorax sp.]|uniref:DUF1801 domain-containing protein n=1 Tax=Acidovorax sp. TaxID=1872122 RepID=UPI00391EF7E1
MATSKPETKPPARKAAAAKSLPSKAKAPTKAPVTSPSPTRKTAALAKPAPAATRTVVAPARKPTAVAKKAAAPAKKTAPSKKQPSATPAKPVLLSGDNPQIAKADGDAPVQAYIAAIPDDWRRGLCARLDALVEANVPEVTKAVRWNSPFYGIAGQGWFLGYHVFAKFIKVSFFKGASLKPAPEGGSGEDARWINVHEGGLDEAQMVAWIQQAAALPGWGKN